jgi:hypothetical protein
MSRDDCNPAFKRETKSFDALQIVSVHRKRKLAPGMRQQRELKPGKEFPERFVTLIVAFDDLDAG